MWTGIGAIVEFESMHGVCVM